MIHAYLILAHHEFAILERLVAALDDFRNDIYIHYDRKVKEIPQIKTEKAGLFIITDRIDVRWGDFSVVEAEYSLFETAQKNGPYAYYHLLSGVDIPLKSQNEIHQFFDMNEGKEFIGFYQLDNQREIDRKVHRCHLFPKDFRRQANLCSFLKRTIRFFVLRLQYVLRIRRNKTMHFKKGTQWVSLTHDFVTYLLSKKQEVIRTYGNTFCSDEIFIQTICWHSTFRERVYNLTDEGLGCMRMIGWENNKLKDWENKDYSILMASTAMIARKFNGKNIELADKILTKIYKNK
ncbi:beta-1,6-N-acetylglucosaminyltransferase [Mucilaginibacter lappiensis]|uniref:Peptide O-xylosyltransferase n=1 Tax=Mucilaginibacter lappiensis TaxID=354630 RepID=A0A841JPR8_9SPHI|nr:beta-1,6-N-acetylglucosaminyltransferase [Mucilaginibacter lappiensis]MBB6130758.1 hypothetical protein [Mucilaginibacter lappiensis]